MLCLAPLEQVREPMTLSHIFLIDVSMYAVESGATASACAAISAVLDSFQGGDNAKVGIACFDRQLSFFSFKESSPQPTMVVVPDVEEPYCPTPGTLLVSLNKYR